PAAAAPLRRRQSSGDVARTVWYSLQLTAHSVPVGSQKAFHVDGEVAAARAAQTKGNVQMLSTQTSSAVEEVVKARGGPVWYQLYTTDNFEITTKLVKRAEAG